MNTPLRVAVLGFSAFERSTFEAFFRLSARRTPAYQLSAELIDCDLVIADADSAAVVSALTAAGKLGRSLAIGAAACDGAAMHLPRPINLMLVVKVLDRMPGEAVLVGAPPSPQMAEPSQSDRILQSLNEVHDSHKPPQPSPAPAPVSAPPVAAAPAAIALAPSAPTQPMPLADPAAEPSPDHAAETSAVMDDILVVDDSDIALRFMASRLERFGFTVHLSRSGEDALLRTEQKRFAYVFMDVTMPGLDGFKTCKTIKRRPYGPGEHPPTVVMLTSRDTPVDKLRGTMAGCDGYLTKPLNELELLKIIGDREITRHEFANTAQANRNY